MRIGHQYRASVKAGGRQGGQARQFYLQALLLPGGHADDREPASTARNRAVDAAAARVRARPSAQQQLALDVAPPRPRTVVARELIASPELTLQVCSADCLLLISVSPALSSSSSPASARWPARSQLPPSPHPPSASPHRSGRPIPLAERRTQSSRTRFDRQRRRQPACTLVPAC